MSRSQIRLVGELTSCRTCGRRISGLGIKLIINAPLNKIHPFCNTQCRRNWKHENT